MFKFRAVILAMLMPAISQAAITFHLRGDSLDAFRALGVGTHGVIAGAPASVTSALPGAFGGKVIDLSGTGKSLSFLAGRNVPSTGAFTLLVRFAPQYTGGAAHPLFNISSGTGSWASGMRVATSGADLVSSIIRKDNADIVLNDTVGTAIGTVTNQLMDLWFSWDGTSTNGSIKAYSAQNGNAPTLLGTGNPSGLAMPSRDQINAGTITLCNDSIAGGCDLLLNELVIWDSQIDPTSFGARAGFISDTAFDGSIIPSVGDIRSGVNSGNGAGTLIVPSLANTKIGVSGDGGTGTYDGSDRWTCPNADNLIFQSPDLKCNSATTNLVGNYLVIGTSSVKIGDQYGAGGGLTGTYDGSDRWTCPSAGDLNFGITLKCNSTSVNLTGTLVALTNIFQAAVSTGSPVSVTQGDANVQIALAAKDGLGGVINITGATFETRLKGTNGTVVIPNSAHTIISGSAGTFRFSLSAANTAALPVGGAREIITKITIGSVVTYFHANNLLTVLRNSPIH